MVTYKYDNCIRQTDDIAFDEYYTPGSEASRSGIYRCISCGREIAATRGEVLPQSDHAQHKLQNGAVRWRLMVSYD